MRDRPFVVGAALAAVVTGCSSTVAHTSPASSLNYGTLPLAFHRTTVKLPPAAGVVDYQLGGSYKPAASVQIVDRDRTSTPAPGRYNVCYVNGFQTQAEDTSFWLKSHPALLLRVGGKLVQDPNWPGEYVLDTSTAAKRTAITSVVGRWFDGCAKKGFQAVEPDNLDSWTRSGVHGAITKADNLAQATLFARRAHHDGLAIAQKNTVEVSAYGGARVHFDFAVAEECQVYGECAGYLKAYGRHVIEIEYTDNGRAAYAAACRARHGRISIVLRDRDVTPRGSRAYYYRHC